jgi:hypothetical protein
MMGATADNTMGVFEHHKAQMDGIHQKWQYSHQINNNAQRIHPQGPTFYTAHGMARVEPMPCSVSRLFEL